MDKHVIKMNRLIAHATRATSRGFVSKEEKQRAVEDWKLGKRTALQICAALDINKGTLTRWGQTIERGKELRESAGRPPIFEEEDIQKFKQILVENGQKANNKHSSQYIPDILRIRNERERMRGHGGLHEDVSRRTIYIMEHSGMFHVGGATQPKTEARAREEASLRNYVSLLVAMKAVNEKIDSHLHFNMDATGFAVEDAKHGGNVWHLKNENDMSKISVGGHGKLPFGVKYFCLGNAAGFIAEPVLIIAVPSMKEDEMAPYHVAGLSGSNQAGSKGWLVCMKTRQPNRKFMDWLVEKLIIPFVHQHRLDYELFFDGDPNKPMPSVMTLDGEEIQMQVFDSERLRGLLCAANIHVIKGPASTTAKTQPLDVGFTFALLKKAAKYSGLACTDGSVFAIFLRRMLDERRLEGGTKTAAVNALQKVSLALKEVMNIKVIKKGFKLTGLAPFRPEIILKRCTVPPTAADMIAIEAGMERLVSEFRETGHNLESTFDELNIRPDTIFDRRSAPKDQRAIQSERCVYMSHHETFDRRLTWLAEHPRAGGGGQAKRGRKSKKASTGPKAKKARVEMEAEVSDDLSVMEEVEEEETASIVDEMDEGEGDEDQNYADYDQDETQVDLGAGRAEGARAIKPSRWWPFSS